MKDASMPQTQKTAAGSQEGAVQPVRLKAECILVALVKAIAGY